jgi:hypothetical protein
MPSNSRAAKTKRESLLYRLFSFKARELYQPLYKEVYIGEGNFKVVYSVEVKETNIFWPKSTLRDG